MYEKYRIKEIFIVNKKMADCEYNFGNYTNILKKGVIVRQYDKFYEDLTEEELDTIIDNTKNDFLGFNPLKKDKCKGIQDYKTVESLYKGDFYFKTMQATAIINYLDEENSYQEQTILSKLIINLKSNDVYMKLIEKELLDDLKKQLEYLNIDISNFTKLKITSKII